MMWREGESQGAGGVRGEGGSVSWLVRGCGLRGQRRGGVRRARDGVVACVGYVRRARA